MVRSGLDDLVEALRGLPGVGPKSAVRMAFHLLQHDRGRAKHLGDSLLKALETIRHCARCNTFTEVEICERCSSPKRDASQLCVVETPIDMSMMEQTQAYRGLYFVLMGRLSPLDGHGPKGLRLEQLLDRATDGVVKEVILATNYTNEGEATAHYLATMLKVKGVGVTRIARGIPVGGELEYIDSGTLAQAFRERKHCAD